MLFCNTDKMSQSILRKFFLKAYCEKINNAEFCLNTLDDM